MKEKINKPAFVLRAAALVALCSVLFVCGAQAKAYSADEIDALARDIIEYELAQSGAGSVQKWIDGALANGAGEVSEWYCIGLSQSGESYDFTAYADALEHYLAQHSVRGATTRQKYALALLAVGRADSAYVAETLDATVGMQGVMSYVYGLHLINNGCKSERHTADSVISAILSLRLADGGWALTGERSDSDVTAMAVQALAPYYEEKADVRAAVDGALEFLSSKQNADGGYSSYGTDNPESAAQVIVALSSLGIDFQSDSRFIKNGNTVIDGMLLYRLDEGAFAHVMGAGYNRSAASQAYYSLVAYLRSLDGRSPLYIFDSVGAAGSADTEDASDTPEPAETIGPVETAAPEPAETGGNAETSAPENGADTVSAVAGGQEVTGRPGYKLWAIVAIAAAAGIICALFWFTGRRHAKNFIFILALATAAAAVVSLVDIKGADDYYSGAIDTKENAVGSVTITIRCDKVAGLAEHIPADGVILPETKFDIAEGDTVFDVLVEVARTYGIQMENKGANYISGIGYIYEFDFGDLSGWIYRVNGERSSLGCGEYKLSDGDYIEWLYTLELGDDLD
jgi:hypothetical protein